METQPTVLMVDDDPVVSKIYSTLLTRAGYVVEVVPDGMVAIEKLKAMIPNIVLLDIFMPKVNGVEVLKFIRADGRLSKVPVIVFSSSSTSRHIDAAWRLGIAKCLAKDHIEPGQLVDVIQNVLAAAAPPPPAEMMAVPEGSAEAVIETLEQTRQRTMAQIPAIRDDLRDKWQAFVNSESDSRVPRLAELRKVIQNLEEVTSKARFERVLLVAEAMDVLLKEFSDQPSSFSASPLRTAGQAIDLLGVMFNSTMPAMADQPGPGNVLLVDKATSSLELAASFRTANLAITSMNDAAIAFKMIEQNRYSCIIWDVDMPQLDGHEMCQKLRGLAIHKKTPVVLITTRKDLEVQVAGGLKGASDYIAKPLMYQEAALKALSHILREQLAAYNQ